MSRQLQIQFPGAIYHVTSCGNRRQPIVGDDVDRDAFFERVGKTVEKYNWQMFAVTLRTNRSHLFVRTPQANLSRGMQFLLSGYAAKWNQRYSKTGHVFQGQVVTPRPFRRSTRPPWRTSKQPRSRRRNHHLMPSARQLSRGEWHAAQRGQLGYDIATANRQHKQTVADAIRAGEDIPPEAYADYSDLAEIVRQKAARSDVASQDEPDQSPVDEDNRCRTWDSAMSHECVS